MGAGLVRAANSRPPTFDEGLRQASRSGTASPNNSDNVGGLTRTPSTVKLTWDGSPMGAMGAFAPVKSLAFPKAAQHTQ